MREEPREIERLNDSQSVVLPVVSKARRVVVFIAVIAIVAVASFAAGMFVRAPQQSALDAASAQVEATFEVEARVVAQGVIIPGRILPGAVTDLTIPAGKAGGTDAARLVVTQQALTPGQVISAGTLLGEVSGRPLISIPIGVPLYRDMVDGSTGADVTALQTALQQMGLDVSVTGEVGPRTLAGVRALYERLGVETADRSVIAWSEFLSVKDGAIVVSSAPVGTVLDVETPLATAKSSADVIVARATVIEADEFDEGQVVQLRAGAVSAESTVQKIGEFLEFEDGSGSGREIIVGIPADFSVGASEPISVSTQGDAEPGPAVPVIALRQDNKGTYVELPAATIAKTGGDAAIPERERIYVRVIAQAEGWAAIESAELLIGTRIYVS